VIAYEVVNMFTGRPFTGSPLAVVPDAGALSTPDMRALSAEINTTETAFVLPPTHPEATYRVRVFTPGAEAKGGGHSCVGTAATLVRLGAVPAGPVTQECGGALQRLHAGPDRATLTARDPLDGVRVEAGSLLAAVGLTPDDLDALSPWATGFGARFPFLPVRDKAVSRAEPDSVRLLAAQVPTLCLFHWDGAARRAHARLFAPGFGIPDDPACAPVALALGALLVHTGGLPPHDGTHTYTVDQGADTGRPATLHGTVEVRDGSVTHAAVTGAVTPVASGHAAVPGTG
jgi:trans-2,3-dihydro-3-hydroxyanthranilate isomerase